MLHAAGRPCGALYGAKHLREGQRDYRGFPPQKPSPVSANHCTTV